MGLLVTCLLPSFEGRGISGALRPHAWVGGWETGGKESGLFVPAPPCWAVHSQQLHSLSKPLLLSAASALSFFRLRVLTAS